MVLARVPRSGVAQHRQCLPHRLLARGHGAPPDGGDHQLVAAVPLGLLLMLWGAGGSGGPCAANAGLLLLQVVLSSAMFVVFFRLQWVGGPTYLSQIGYVAAAVGLLLGVFFLDEHYPQLVWAGAAAIALGVAISNWPERRA